MIANWYETVKLHYSDMNPFMQRCMNTYWESRFYNGVLRYTPTDGSAGVTLKFADLNEEGTFDLSACGNTGQYLVITTSMDRFFQIQGENIHKTVILVTPRSFVEQGINTSPSHPFAAHMAGWDVDKAPVGMFWRWANFTNLTWVDYLTNADMFKISSVNLYGNWEASRCIALGLGVSGGSGTNYNRAHAAFHVDFCPEIRISDKNPR